MLYHVTLVDRTFQVRVSPEGVEIDGRLVETDLARLEGTLLKGLRVDSASHHVVAYHLARGRWDLNISGYPLEVEVVDDRTRAIRELTGAAAAGAGPKPVVAPMPGLVVKVDVSAGDAVEPGEGVVIVEAMKMENELKAEAGGVVARVHVRAGDTVDKGQVLVDFESPEVGEDD
jgi:pyruvate carboxylase subunit B